MIDVTSIQIVSSSKIPQVIIDGLKMLWTTPVGTVALDRDFGINMSFVDMPIPKSKQMFTVEVYAKTKKYEPRISIKKISFTVGPLEGKLIPIIEIGV